MAPWRLLRYGARKAIPYLYQHIRRVTYKSAHPPIPRIVLIRVDGEAVPVKFAEDCQVSVDVGVWSSLESANLGVGNSRAKTSEGGEHQDSVPSLVSSGDSCIATEVEALFMRAVSHQGRVTKAEDDIGLEWLRSEFPEDSPTDVNEIPDQQAELSPVLVETENEPLQSVEKDILILPIPDALIVTTGDSRGVDEGTDILKYVAFVESVANGISQDGTGSLEEREDSDQDLALSPWSLVDDQCPNDSETSSEIVIAVNSSVGFQDTSTPVKNVRFAVCHDAGAADRGQVSLSASHTDEYPTCAWTHESQPEDDGVRLVQIPVVPFDPSMDTTVPEQMTQPVLSVVLSEEGVEEIDMLAQSLSPSSTEMPVVNLPSLVTTREDVRFVEMVPMVPAALIEDVMTRSPLQILCPIVPVVVLNMKRIIKAEEQSSTPPGVEEPHQDAFNRTETLNDKAAICGMLDIVSPREDRSYPPSPSIEGLDSVCSPIVDTEPPFGYVRTPIALSASATACEIGMPAADTSLVIVDTSPSAVIKLPETNGLEAEILYETPRYSSGGKDLARSLRNGLQGPEVSVPGTPSTNIHLSATSGSPKEPETKDQANFVAAGKSDSMTITFRLSGQPVGLSCAVATELPTTKLSKEVLALPCKEVRPLSMISAGKKTGQLDDERSRETNTIPCDHPGTISKPPPERTLSGSMHAPSEPLPIPQSRNYTDETFLLYETPPSLTYSVPSTDADDGKVGTSTITENKLEREQDLFASIHAPQRISKAQVQSCVSQSRDEIHCDHRRSVTNLVVVSNNKPVTKPSPPNWAAMPDVVDAFRMFKEAPSGNTIQRVSSIVECTNRAPMIGEVGQKGIVTNSLNNTAATANIQSRWMYGNGLLLVRDLVPSDPADFNLRTW